MRKPLNSRLAPVPTDDRSAECPDASSALAISYRFTGHGRHLTASRHIQPGEILYVGEAYVAVPMKARVHSHCSHCLRFAWAGLPCEGCAHAIFCSEACRQEAMRLYHDVECRILDRAWKLCERMGAGRMMSVRLLVMGLREAGGLHELRASLGDVQACAG